MSKAFTRESDDLPERSVLPRPKTTLPPGVKNHLTPDGAVRFQEEWARLTQIERPQLLAQPTSDTNRESLKRLDQRVLELEQILQTAHIVAVPPEPHDSVRFGALAELKEPDGSVTQYRVVGVDETDLDRNWISWRSPLAKALLGARIGQIISIQTPVGNRALEVLRVWYPLE